MVIVPSEWVLLASAADIGIVFLLAVTGTLMAPLPIQVLAGVLAAAVLFALLLDQIKLLAVALAEVQ